MDAKNMKYNSNFFDLIIDKSTIDTLLCGNFQTAYFDLAVMLKECQRTLKTGGFYVAISFDAPEKREFHFEREHLDFELTTYFLRRHDSKTGEDALNYMYVCQKKPGADEKM